MIRPHAFVAMPFGVKSGRPSKTWGVYGSAWSRRIRRAG